MNKVLYKLFVSVAGFLNGEHSKAQLPEVTFSCSPPFQIPKRHRSEHINTSVCVGMCVCTYVCRMHIAYCLHLLLPPLFSKNGRAEYLLKNMKMVFVTHTVLCIT